MRAMLLTAGYGERMYPLTGALPKPAIPVLGRPLAIQCIRWLGRFGPEKVVLNLHHLPDVLQDLLGDGTDFGLPPIGYSHEPAILGTAGGLRQAQDLLSGSGPIVVCNGDFLADIELGDVLAAHSASGLPATLVLAPHRPPYSAVDVDAEGRVVSLAGIPEVDPGRVAGSYLFTGCHVLEEELLDRIPSDGPSDIVRHVYRRLAEEGRLGSYIHEGFWWEFGSPELYLEGSLHLLDLSVKQRRRVTDHDPVRRIGRAVGALGPAAKYDGRAGFRGYVALGFAVHVSEDCHLEDTVVMPESWIGPGCRLTRCIVGPGVELPAKYEASRSLICVDPGESDDEDPPTLRREDGLAVLPLADLPE